MMDFKEALQIINEMISETSEKKYDGILVKRLEASNTLDEGRTTNQTHIAITGEQMNIFPYLMAEGYFNCNYDERDEQLKKYFITQIPLEIHKNNVIELVGDDILPKEIQFNGCDVLKVKASIVRSRRKAQTDQVQLSLTSIDDPAFVAFRRLIHAGDYMIILKHREKFDYDCYGIRKTTDFKDKLESLNNKFYKDATNTKVNVTELLADTDEHEADNKIKNGTNILYYGVPGAGKSHEIDKMIVQDRSERVVFHPDYTYSDFVGQILPRVVDEKLKYVFEPGPFTKMLKKANDDPANMYFLVIEEINRGNAPAIFGDIFQLLDRNDDGSEKYHISNYDIAKIVYGDENHIIKIPSNLTLLATMNTSDQNVFTLDTAFQRRWEMHLIKNDVAKAIHSRTVIEGSLVSWGKFADVTNAEIIRFGEETGSSEDKRLGAYFARINELTREKFPEKVLKYLWDDAFKMDRYSYFNENMSSLDMVIEVFREEPVSQTDLLKRVLKYGVYTKMVEQVELQSNEEGNVDGE